MDSARTAGNGIGRMTLQDVRQSLSMRGHHPHAIEQCLSAVRSCACCQGRLLDDQLLQYAVHEVGCGFAHCACLIRAEDAHWAPWSTPPRVGRPPETRLADEIEHFVMSVWAFPALHEALAAYLKSTGGKPGIARSILNGRGVCIDCYLDGTAGPPKDRGEGDQLVRPPGRGVYIARSPTGRIGLLHTWCYDEGHVIFRHREAIRQFFTDALVPGRGNACVDTRVQAVSAAVAGRGGRTRGFVRSRPSDLLYKRSP